MAIKSILSPVIVEDTPVAREAADFGARLAALLGARLQALIVVPRIPLPAAFALPAARAMVDEANAGRKRRAEQFRTDLGAVKAGGIVDCEIVADRYLEARARIVAAARMSDLVVMTPAAEVMEARHDVMRALLFESGRPLLLVPPGWDKAPAWKRVVVAWDGGAPSADRKSTRLNSSH